MEAPDYLIFIQFGVFAPSLADFDSYYSILLAAPPYMRCEAVIGRHIRVAATVAQTGCGEMNEFNRS